MDIPRREASRDLSSAIYLALWTNPEGDNCFSIYQISWRKIKKEIFVKKDVTLLQFVFFSIDSVSGIIFYDFVANWQQAKFCHFLGICWRSCFIYRYNFIFRNCRETRSYFESCPKTVNIQGYSELREPIRTRENFFPLPDLVKTKLSISLIKFSFLKYISWFHKGSSHVSKLELDFAQKFWFSFRNWTCFFMSQKGFAFLTEISGLSNKVFLLIS